jgi:hypothetical protein
MLGRLALETFQHGLVRDPFVSIEVSEKPLDRGLELTFRPIAHFPPILLAERTVRNPTRHLLKATNVSIPAHEIDE